MTNKTLYTIGYAGFSLPAFLATLEQYGINVIVDVRAMPQISHFECYKGSQIEPVLNENGIHYKFFGRVFGARPDNPAFLTDGKVDFAKIRETEEFQDTCGKLAGAMRKGFTLCLMCAQIDPIICHRSIMITDYFRYLYPEVAIRHITSRGCESQQELDERVLALYRKNRYENSLLAPPELEGLTELQKAYAWQGRQIAYAPK